MRRARNLAGMLLALLPGASLMGADSPQPPPGYDYCTLCHGATGGGNRAILAPALAGIERWYLDEQLRAYREQHRGKDFATDAPGAEMRTVTREIRAEELGPIADYLAKLRPVRQPPSVEGDARRGRGLYDTHCSACHGQRGEGNAALHAPALTRLNDWYVVDTFRRYQTGTRGAEAAQTWPNAMHQVTRALPADFAIADVARYLDSIGP